MTAPRRPVPCASGAGAGRARPGRSPTGPAPRLLAASEPNRSALRIYAPPNPIPSSATPEPEIPLPKAAPAPASGPTINQECGPAQAQSRACSHFLQHMPCAAPPRSFLMLLALGVASRSAEGVIASGGASQCTRDAPSHASRSGLGDLADGARQLRARAFGGHYPRAATRVTPNGRVPASCGGIRPRSNFTLWILNGGTVQHRGETHRINADSPFLLSHHRDFEAACR